LRRAREEGGRHIAIMAHLSHGRELGATKVQGCREPNPEGGFCHRSFPESNHAWDQRRLRGLGRKMAH
jgi:hypothetical protein